MWSLLETNLASGSCVTGVDCLSQWASSRTWRVEIDCEDMGEQWEELGAYGNKGPECLHPGTLGAGPALGPG